MLAEEKKEEEIQGEERRSTYGTGWVSSQPAAEVHTGD
jgi:hypothetical protein